jgi:nucleotide-binding universal stress UspA family protein
MSDHSAPSPIVCGVDDSPEAAVAAQFAGRLAALLERPLALVHAAPKPRVSERPFGDYPERLEQQAAFHRAGYFGTVLAPLEVTGPAEVERIIEWSTIPEDALRSVAERLAAELIVVGNRGQSPIEDVLVPGSISAAMARSAPVPVVLTPPVIDEASVGLPGDALACGVDGSELSIAAARATARLAERLGVPLVMVNVESDSDDSAGEDKTAAAVAEAAAGVEVRTERSRGPVAEELVAAAVRHGAGLIAVGSRGRGALKSVLLGSVTAGLLRISDRPVLVVSRSAANADVPE